MHAAISFFIWAALPAVNTRGVRTGFGLPLCRLDASSLLRLLSSPLALPRVAAPPRTTTMPRAAAAATARATSRAASRRLLLGPRGRPDLRVHIETDRIDVVEERGGSGGGAHLALGHVRAESALHVRRLLSRGHARVRDELGGETLRQRVRGGRL